MFHPGTVEIVRPVTPCYLLKNSKQLHALVSVVYLKKQIHRLFLFYPLHKRWLFVFVSVEIDVVILVLTNDQMTDVMSKHAFKTKMPASSKTSKCNNVCFLISSVLNRNIRLHVIIIPRFIHFSLKERPES